MELSIQKWGNSAAVRLPTTLLEQLKVALGDKLSVEVRPDGVMLKPAVHKYSLDELLAQCDSRRRRLTGWMIGAGISRLGAKYGEAREVRPGRHCAGEPEPNGGREQQGISVPRSCCHRQHSTLWVLPGGTDYAGRRFRSIRRICRTVVRAGTETQGVALVNMVRTLDLEARGARKIERAPAEVVEDALARLQTILD